jgi:hypothetical protein
MKTAVLTTLVASAAAFAPAKQAQTSTALADYSEELGVIAPTGFWDPLGLSSKIDQDTFDTYRAAELKHGRVAQLAVIGYVVQEACRFPGNLSLDTKFADIPNGLDAIKEVPFGGWAQILIGVALVEYKGLDGSVGSFAQGQLDLPEDILEKRQLCELQHGRIAMLAIAELVRHDITMAEGDKLITGLPFLY